MAPLVPSDSKIGFPPPYLGPDPRRLTVLLNLKDVAVVEKPRGILGVAHDWYPRMPNLVEAINHQVDRGKMELQRLGIGRVGPVFGVDPEISGAVLLAKSPSDASFDRNQFGSREMNLVFSFFTRGGAAEAELDCGLPLARHRAKPRLVVTKRHGKQAATVFSVREKFEGFSYWDARMDFCRLHQLRIHAAESGIPIVGERVYANVAPIFLSRLKPQYRARPGKIEHPLHAGVCAHLRQVRFNLPSGNAVTVDIPAPRTLELLHRKLRLHREKKNKNMLYSSEHL